MSARLQGCLLIALVSAADAKTLSDRLGMGLPSEAQLLSPALAQAIGRALPVLSISPGVRFEYDPATGAYARHVVIDGEVLVEDATTIGAGHLNASLSYEYLQFDRLGGQPLRSLSQRRPVSDEAGNPIFTIPRLDIDLAVQQAAATLSYGVTERADLQVVLPLVHADLVQRNHVVFSGGLGDTPAGTSGDATGLGDVFVRGKVVVFHDERWSLAAALGIRTPTGDADNLLGAGTTEVVPGLYGATSAWQLANQVDLRLKVNLSMDFTAKDVQRSQGRWAVACDIGFGERVRAGLGLLGAHDVDHLIDQHALDTPVCKPCRGPQRRAVEEPLFGIDAGRADSVAFLAGARAVLWKDQIIGFANVVVPMLDQGVVTAPVPLVGLEFAF